VTNGTLPAGLALSATTGAITGTPSHVARSTFTVTVTDSAGNTGSQAYTVAVAATPVPVPVAVTVTVTPASLADGTSGSAYSQTISATGGTGPYSFALSSGAFPEGLSLNGSTGALTGTPVVAGSYTFTLTAADANGVTGSRSYGLAIAAAPVPVPVPVPATVLTLSPGTLPAATIGSPFSQMLSTAGGTGPYGYSVSGALPTGLSLNASTGEITGTPSETGSFSFTITATDSAGNTGSQAYTIAVAAAEISVASTNITIEQPESGFAEAVTLDLATLVSFSETAGKSTTAKSAQTTTTLQFEIVRNPAHGTVKLVGSIATYQGNRGYSGEDSFDFVATLGLRRSNVGTVTILTKSRPLLNEDPALRGLVSAQFEGAARLAEAQVSNVMRHLEGVRGGSRCGFAQDVAVNDASAQVQPLPGSEAAPIAAAPARSRGTNCVNEPALGLWASGSIDVDDEKERFKTRGVTAGVDARIADGLVVGAAVGFGQDEAQLGQARDRSKMSARTIAAYASARPRPSIFVDAVVGYADLDLDTRRSISEDEALLGARAGSVFYGSLSLGTSVQAGRFSLSPYIRNDHVFIKLDELLEEAANVLAVSMEKTSGHGNVVVAGGKAELAIPVGEGLLSPHLRIEYRNRSWGGFSQDLAYSDTPLEAYRLLEARGSNGQISASFGLRLNFRTFDFQAEYGTSTNTLRSFGGGSFRIGGRIKF
jgi:hypothetical protein